MLADLSVQGGKVQMLARLHDGGIASVDGIGNPALRVDNQIFLRKHQHEFLGHHHRRGAYAARSERPNSVTLFPNT